MLVVGPEVPREMQPLMRSVVDAIRELQAPGRPTRVAKVAFASLPPAADWPDCVIEVSDRNALAISTLSGATYAWTRADGSAL